MSPLDEDNCFLAFKSLNTFSNTFLVLIANLTAQSNIPNSIIQINAQLEDCISVLESIYSDSSVPVWMKETERVIEEKVLLSSNLASIVTRDI